MPYFVLGIFQPSALCTRFHLCSSSMSVLSTFIFTHATFSIKFILLFSSSNLLWEVGNSSCFLLCGISEISQAVPLSLLPVWQAFMIFLKAILVLVSSAHECLFLRLFSQAIWHLWLQFATRKASRENWLNLVKTKEQLFISQPWTWTEVQKHSKTFCFWIPETHL